MRSTVPIASDLYIPLTDTETTSTKTGTLEKQEMSLGKTTPRWLTHEFFMYYFVLLVAAYYVLTAAFSLSQHSHPNYPQYSRFIRMGWMFGRGVDMADHQYRGFRENMKLLAVFLGTYAAISELGFKVFKKRFNEFRAVMNVMILVILHGTNAIKIALQVLIGFGISHHFKDSRLNPTLTWIHALTTLFLLEWTTLPFKSLGLPFLDNYFGLYPRWHVIFNVTILRQISFNLDHYFAHHPTHLTRHSDRCNNCTRGLPCHKADIIKSCDLSYYNLTNYLTYIFYPPLYLAGPIMTFNSFMNQTRKRVWKTTVLYGVRLVIAILLLEFILHFFWVVAIKEGAAFNGLRPLDIFSIAYLNLKIIWLKLLVIWRLFRFFSLLDATTPPENMLRCMSNNYSLLGFWRQWHSSFNQWITRYMYIPMGGTKHLFWNVWPVFTFVALWHDMNLNLLAWGWLISAFIAPELLVTKFIAPRCRHLSYYRHLKATAASLNILLMMTANLVGFAVGVDGAKLMLKQLYSFSGIIFFVCILTACFSAAQLMFEWRAEEERRGLSLKY